MIGRTVKGQPATPIVAGWRLPELDAERAAVAGLVRAAITSEGEAGRLILRHWRLKDGETNPDGWKRLIDVRMRARHVTKASGRKAARP